MEWLKTPEKCHRIQIIDVRQDDWQGGNIRSSINIPFDQLDNEMKNIFERTRNMDDIVFHCTFSQQRGPAAAEAYCDFLNSLPVGQINKQQNIYILRRGYKGWKNLVGEDSDWIEDNDSQTK